MGSCSDAFVRCLKSVCALLMDMAVGSCFRSGADTTPGDTSVNAWWVWQELLEARLLDRFVWGISNKKIIVKNRGRTLILIFLVMFVEWRICVGNLIIIGPDNGLAPGRHKAIIWANAAILLIGPSGTTFSEIIIEILSVPFKIMRLKGSSAKWRPFCFDLKDVW